MNNQNKINMKRSEDWNSKKGGSWSGDKKGGSWTGDIIAGNAMLSSEEEISG